MHAPAHTCGGQVTCESVLVHSQSLSLFCIHQPLVLFRARSIHSFLLASRLHNRSSFVCLRSCLLRLQPLSMRSLSFTHITSVPFCYLVFRHNRVFSSLSIYLLQRSSFYLSCSLHYLLRVFGHISWFAFSIRLPSLVVQSSGCFTVCFRNEWFVLYAVNHARPLSCGIAFYPFCYLYNRVCVVPSAAETVWLWTVFGLLEASLYLYGLHVLLNTVFVGSRPRACVLCVSTAA